MKNTFIEKYIIEHGLTVLHFDEEKPWGAYYVIEETSDYDKKILWIKPGQYLSLQYHGNPTHLGHREEGEGLTDIALVLGKTDVSLLSLEAIYKLIPQDLEILTLKKGEQFHTSAGVLHAYINPFDHDIYLLETRISQTPEQATDRENNIVRVYDTTMRDGTPNWPEWLVKKIVTTVESK